MQKSAYSDLEKALMLQSLNEANELGMFKSISSKTAAKKPKGRSKKRQSVESGLANKNGGGMG
jgi:hypothetical protein